MSDFIEDYLKDPSQAILKARECASTRFDHICEDMVYDHITSPEFHLYQEICGISDSLNI